MICRVIRLSTAVVAEAEDVPESAAVSPLNRFNEALVGIVVVILLLTIVYINIDVRYYKDLSAYKETPLWSSAIFDLVKTLEKEKGKKVIAGDWGLSRFVFYISNGKMQAKEIFGYTSDSNFFLKQLEKESRNADNIYIFYFQKGSLNRLDAFRHFMKERGILYDEAYLLNQEGGPVYEMCTLSRAK